ncbi:twin-arginine translocase TatA/TatE family subunit [Paenibacillus sp. 598K]|uniref:twin-arginine translocase TatA/TatE family subunit n=1 Tax=Paenibacillus sp. 598K TaxID=1117987 RepID=UPI000FF97861|nr:twin-arginine translocase TatA/TatE family subunit [Paenibacillus sp. 598K]GBF77258.1 twin-arginine translocase TatA/TatE family subunit [Paenibacillus sp. 598K]
MGLGTSGIILLAIVALLLFGPNKLPELGRAFGRTLREFKNGAKDIMGDDEQTDRKTVSAVQADAPSTEPTNNKRLPD